MQENLQQALLVIAWITSALLIVQVLSRRESNRFSTWVFSGYILLQTIATFFFFLVNEGYILEYWYLYRVPAPLSFLIPPLSYLYVRSVLEDDTRFRRADGKHFILFGFVFVHYLPYFLKSKEEKIAHITAVLENYSENLLGKEGLFPEDVISLLRTVQFFVYVWLHWKLITQTPFFQKDEYTGFEKHLRFWIRGFTVAVTAFYISIAIGILSYLIADQFDSLESVLPVIELSRVWSWWIVLFSYLFFSGYLLIYPEVHLGKMNLKNKKSDSPFTESDDAQEDLHHIKTMLTEKKLWLDPALNLYEFSRLSGLSPRRTSYLLNNFYNGNFNSVINKHRIEYAIYKIDHGYLSQFTTDSLWKECGFSNPSTFFTSFKKIMKMTPVEYAKTLESRQ